MKKFLANLWRPGPDPENKHVGTWREWIPFVFALVSLYLVRFAALGGFGD